MGSMIEKVARALCDGNWDAANFNETPNGESPEELRAYWMEKAEAAIEAMREPTGRMEYMMDMWLGAKPHDGFGKQRWQQLIDASLQESEEKAGE